MKEGFRYINLRDEFDGGEFVFQNGELIRCTADPREFPLDFAPVQKIKEEDWIEVGLYEKVVKHKAFLNFKYSLRTINLTKIISNASTWEIENLQYAIEEIQKNK